MSSFNFGRASSAEFVTLHHDLQIILTGAIEVFDFSITQGGRTIEEQVRNIRRGVSKTIDSRHIPRDEGGMYDPNAPCIAADCAPYQGGVNPWPQDSDTIIVRQKKAHRFYFMQGIFYSIAKREWIKVRQGVDWDMDGDIFDQTFDDLPHIELRLVTPPLVLPKDMLRIANEALMSRGLREYRNP